MADTQKAYDGSYNTQNMHPLASSIIAAAISDWEAIATKFGMDAIKDS